MKTDVMVLKILLEILRIAIMIKWPSPTFNFNEMTEGRSTEVWKEGSLYCISLEDQIEVIENKNV